MSVVGGFITGERVWKFPGGLKLNGHKALSATSAIEIAPIPKTLILPLSQHIGAAAKPLVEVGDYVYRGQTIAAPDGYVSTPIHASSSGTVVAIEERPVPHPSGLTAECIVIETDGKDAALPTPELEAHSDYSDIDPSHLRNLVRQAGVVGLGGAAFPSFIKLNPGPGAQVDALILNGAECEPYITCDQVLMREQATDIIHGAQLIMHAVQAPTCLIGVEDNKPESIDALNKAIAELGDGRIKVVVVPTRYPQGGEKQLVQALTGREVPSEGLPLDIGIVCHNVGTAATVWRAVTLGQPLISRVMTVTGGAIKQPRNFEVRIGTPVSELIEMAGGTVATPERLVMGGPMMGFALSGTDVPVVKATNCILAQTATETAPAENAMPCIRCGECAEVCPAGLLPQQLYWHSRAKDLDRAQEYKLFDCIECGCCAQVCPSHIPLVQYYRFAKTEIWEAERDKRKSNHARERHEFRQERIEREEAEKQARLAAKKAAIKDKESGKPDPVADAIARAKARKAEGADTEKPAAKPEKTNSDAVADLIAQAKAKAAQKKADSPKADKPKATTGDDPVAAAIAKAKQKAADKQSDDAPAKDKPVADDPVAAAIAKAKAKAADKKAIEDKPATDDPVAAAIAKAKAKAAEKKADEDKPAKASDDDPVAAAIAKAKQKAAAKKADTSPETEQKPADDDPVAAAIARAKAKAAERKKDSE